MGFIWFLLPILIIIPILILLILFNVITVSYGELGLSQGSAIALLVAQLIGCLINIPITNRKVADDPPQSSMSRYFYYYAPPRTGVQTIAVNVGGALIPTLFSIYLMPRASFLPTLLTTLAVIVVSRLASRVVPGEEITMPGFLPALVAAGLALLLEPSHPAPVAYIAGTLGTLIGADLLNWPNFYKLGPYTLSIGGAGVFDGVFLSGVFAVAISSI